LSPQGEAQAAATAKTRLRCFGRCDHIARTLSRHQDLSKDLSATPAIYTPSRKSHSSYIANALWGSVRASDAECAVPPRLARNRPVNPPDHLYTIITDVADRLNPTALIEPGLLPALPRLRRAERWVESGLLEEAVSLMYWPIQQ
jgi:hypothetical protein